MYRENAIFSTTSFLAIICQVVLKTLKCINILKNFSLYPQPRNIAECFFCEANELFMVFQKNLDCDYKHTYSNSYR